MKVLKPPWVSHNGQPIFSIDIHPDGSRFATGGQGDDAGKIIIWNMAPVRDADDELDESVPKILCQMDNHLACVNCVRWSASGKFLASGGDDKLIMIWQTSRYGVGSTVFGGSSKIVESWRPVHTLRSHTGDVLGLAWSPNDVWLASCSIDNSIIVWNAEKFPEQIAVLKGHTGLVKGVTWDPVGKYLASQSDDKTLRIWRTRDWQLEKCITEPFKECGGTTHVLRCDWSPDGHYVVSAHAMNNSGPTAQIIERQGWTASLDFVGHRKAVSVVRFNPFILSKKLKKDSGKLQQYTCCAIGSRDRSLSIWLTALKRPLVVMRDVFNNSILDISWGQNGTELICCSCDGTVAYLDFQSGELGSPLPREDMHRLLEKIYGKCVAQNSSKNSGSEIIESAAVLKLQQQQKSPDEKSRVSVSESVLATPTKSNSSLLFNGDSKSPFKPTDKQIETKTADGRRRITPIFLSPQPDVGEVPVPFSSKAGSNIQFESSKVRSTIQVEKQDKITHPGFLSPSSQSQSSPPILKAATSSTPKSNSSEAVKNTNANSKSSPIEKTQASVSSIVQPLAALDSSKAETPRSSTFAADGSKQELSKSITSSPDKHVKFHDSEKKKGGLSLKRKIGPDGQPRKRGRPRLIDKDGHRPSPGVTPVIAQTPVTTERETVKYVSSSTDLQLPALSIEKVYTRQVTGGPAGDEGLALEVENSVQAGSLCFHKVKFTKGGNLVWEQVVSSKILAVAGSSCFGCVACEDRSLTMFNSSGCKIFPCIVLNSKVSVLEAKGQYLLAVTQKGSVYVWNMNSRTAVIKNEQLSSLVKAEDKIVRASITTEGVPLLTFTNHKSYSFHPDMCCWILVHDRNDKLQQCSVYNTSKLKGSMKLSGPLSSLQVPHDRVAQPAASTFQTSQGLKQLSTLNHLESQVAACFSLKSGTEYKFWLLTYVRYLVQEGLEDKLREVCDELLGPIYKSKKTSAWSEWVLGLNKHSLLREILPCFGSNLGLQRIYTEYQEQLESVASIT